MSINGIFFPGRVLTAKGLGAFGAGALSDGILEGCAVSVSGGSVSIGSGYVIIGGRVFGVSGAESGSVSGAYTVLYAKADTSKASSAETFQQVTISAAGASSAAAAAAVIRNAASGYPAEDLNGASDAVRTCWLALIEGSSVVAVNRAAAAGGMVKLWENSSPTSGLGATDLDLPAIGGYDTFLAVFRRDDADTAYGNIITSVACPMEGLASRRFVCTDFGLADNTYSGRTCLRERWVDITPGSGRVSFTTGWWTGWNNSAWTYANDPGTLVPVALYGIHTLSGIS